MDEYLEEELQIMQEQIKNLVVDPDIFQKPISVLRLPIPQILDENSSIAECVDIMQKNKFGSVMITSDNQLVGIFTERDVLMRVIGAIKDIENTPVRNVMTPNPTSLRVDDRIAFVLHNMHVGGYRHVPIVNKRNEPISIVSIKDVLSYILDQFPSEVTNMASQPFRGPGQREGA